MIFLIAYFLAVLPHTSQQQNNCVGFSASTKNCYECAYSYFHSPNMTSDKLIFPSNCTARKNESLTLRYYIATKKCINATLCNGTEQYPFDEINRAFWMAHSQANERNYAEVEFLFLGSPHYILRKNLPQVNFGYFRRINMTVTITPCFCSFKNLSGCFGPNESALVYVKTDSFNIYVAYRLSIKNMIFNGTDMHLLIDTKSNDVNHCHNKEQICCNYTQLNTIFVSNSKTPCALIQRTSTVARPETWSNRTSFWNVEPILDDPGRNFPQLVLENLLFCDMYALKSVNGWLSLIMMGSNSRGSFVVKNITVWNVRLIKGVILVTNLEEIIPNVVDFKPQWALRPGEIPTVDIANSSFLYYNKFIVYHEVFKREQLGIISLFDFPGIFHMQDILSDSFIFDDFEYTFLHFENTFLINFENVTISNFKYVRLINLFNSSMTVLKSSFENVSTMEGLKLQNGILTLLDSIVLNFEGLFQYGCLFFEVSKSSFLSLSGLTVLDSKFFSTSVENSRLILFNISYTNILLEVQLIKLANTVFQADCLKFEKISANIIDLIEYRSTHLNPCIFSNIFAQFLKISAFPMLSFFRWANAPPGSQLFWYNASIVDSSIPQVLLVEKLGQLVFSNVTIADLNFVGLIIMDVSSIGNVSIRNLVLSNIYSEFYLIKVGICYEVEDCGFSLMNMTVANASKNTSDWITLQVSRVKLENILIDNLYNVFNNLAPRRIFFLDTIHYLVVQNVSLLVFQQSFRCLLEMNNNLEVYIRNINIINEWRGSEARNFFASAISGSKGKLFLIDNVRISGLVGLPTESSIGYKNGLMNFYGSDSDMIKRENDIRIIMKNIEIKDSGGCPNGVIGFSNIAFLALENLKFENTSSIFKGGGLIISLASLAELKNIYFSNTRSLEGGCIYLNTLLSIILVGIEINDSMAGDGGAAHFSLITNLFIQDFWARKSHCFGKGGLIYMDKVGAQIININVTECSSAEEGGIFFVTYGKLNIEKGEFLFSSGSKGGVAAVLYAEALLISDVSILGAESLESAVSFLLLEIGVLSMDNITITNSSGPAAQGNIYLESQGGGAKFFFHNLVCKANEILHGNCLYFQGENDIEIVNITIQESGGSAFYFISRRGCRLFFINCSFRNNRYGKLKLDNDYFAFFQNLEVLFSGNENVFKANSALETMLFFEDSNLTIENTLFLDNTGADANKTFCDVSFYGGKIVARNLTRSFAGVQMSLSLSFLYLKSGSIRLINSSVSECMSTADRACISLEGSSSVLFEQNKFFNNRGTRVGTVYAKYSNLTLIGCTFSNNSHNSPFSIENVDFGLPPVELRASDILFEALSTKSAIALQLRRCSFGVIFNVNSLAIYKTGFFFIENCTFKGEALKSAALFLFASSGGIVSTEFSGLLDNEGGPAVKLLNFDASIRLELNITSSRFLKNQGNLGGAMLFQGFLAVRITNSAFTANKANQRPGIGGVIYFSCLVCQSSLFSLSGNEFLANFAENFASTVFSQVEIKLEEARPNKFQNNSDGMGFTEFLSSFPMTGRISGIFDSLTGQRLKWNTDSAQEIDSIVSGRLFDFNLTLIDSFGQTLLFENSSDSTLKKTADSKAQIFGGFGQSSMGIHSFRKTRVNFKPNSFLELEVSINFDEKLILPRILERNPLNKLQLKWGLYLRPRLKGEIIIISDVSCYFCKEGEYSLEDPMTVKENQTIACKPCPEGARCPGGSDLIPENGFWRASEHSSKIIECLSKSFCLGGNVRQATAAEKISGRCLIHHEGIMCYKCEKGFARAGNKGICEACHSNIFLQLKIAVSLLLVFCYIMLQIKFTFSGESRSSSVAILMKQLLTHAQLIQMISVLDLGWTPDILDYFHYQEYFSFLSEEMVSLDCVFASLEEDNLVLRVYAANLIPPIVTLTALVNLSIYALYLRIIRKRTVGAGKFFTFLKASLVVIIYVFFPEILKKSFSLMNCVIIDDVKNTEVLTYSPENLCWNDLHYDRVYKISLPGILFWGALIPIVALVLLLRNRREVRNVIRTRRDLKNASTGDKSVPRLGVNEASTALLISENASSIMKKTLGGSSVQAKSASERINMKFKLKTSLRDSIKVSESETPLTPMKIGLQERGSEPKSDGIALIFKFLYRGYKEKYFYWEFIIYIKKFIFTVVSSFTGLFPSNTKASIVLVIISFFLLLQARYRPFEVPHLNNVEFFSLLVTFLTANVGIMLYSEDLKQFSTVFLVFLIAFNFLFVLYWIFVFLKEFCWGFKSKGRPQVVIA